MNETADVVQVFGGKAPHHLLALVVDHSVSASLNDFLAAGSDNAAR